MSAAPARRPLRLAMFTDSFYPELGGIQDSIAACAAELGARGHQVTICAPDAAPRDFARRGLAPIELDMGPNVRVHRSPSVALPSSSQQSRLAFTIGSGGRDAASLLPDIVHSHTFLSLGRHALRVARYSGAPLVGTNHWAVGAFDVYAPVARGVLRRLAVAAVTRYYRRCDWVTGPSAFTTSELLRSGLGRPCQVISNPIDTKAFRPLDAKGREAARRRWGLTHDTIVYAGRLAREKDLDMLLHAFAAVRARRPGCRLVLAGHGSYRGALQVLCRVLGVEDSVRFVGTLEHAALRDLFAASDLFAIASKSETQSMVVLQAMACGLPVVGVRCGGLAEYVPADVGLLAEADDVQDIRDKLLALLCDPSDRRLRGAAALRFAQTVSVERVADAWEALYARLLREWPTEGS